MIDTRKIEECCGCTACADICGRNAITMKEDAMGFLHPVVNADLCVDCGRCSDVCMIDREPELKKPASVHAMRLRDKAEMAASQSGGAFTALSDAVLAEGGVVYGTGFGESFQVRHAKATDKSGRDSFRGSKYVQSDMRGIYRDIAADLNNGITVMFTGTPCQCAAVKKYTANIKKGDLIIVDLICHGVASPKIFRDYIRYLEKKYGKRIIGMRFRDKDFGWQSHRESFILEDGTKISPKVVVYKDHFLRESCNICRFCSTDRISDITIGDFWGIEKIDSTFASDAKGCSMILCNTGKGTELFEHVRPACEILDIDSNANFLQMNLSRPTPASQDPLFAPVYRLAGFRTAMYLFGRMGKPAGLRRRLGALKKRVKGGGK